MTNEELAVLIKAGYTEYIPQLWEQVDKFIWMKANWCADVIDGRAGWDVCMWVRLLGPR